MISLLPVTDTHYSFLFTLFKESKEDEFLFLSISDLDKHTLIEQQFNIQQHAYSTQFPQQHHSIITFQTQQVGQVRIGISPSFFHIIDISIYKKFQNLGIASSIIENLQHEARGANKDILLHVVNTNRARYLYERLGFETINEKYPYVEMRWQI